MQSRGMHPERSWSVEAVKGSCTGETRRAGRSSVFRKGPGLYGLWLSPDGTQPAATTGDRPVGVRDRRATTQVTAGSALRTYEYQRSAGPDRGAESDAAGNGGRRESISVLPVGQKAHLPSGSLRDHARNAGTQQADLHLTRAFFAIAATIDLCGGLFLLREVPDYSSTAGTSSCGGIASCWRGTGVAGICGPGLEGCVGRTKSTGRPRIFRYR
jgi:hypothetical protein